MSGFREQCIALRKRGLTLSEIVRETRRSKTSVYHHIRDLPLNDARKRVLKADAQARARRLAMSRKGKSSRSFRPFDTWTPEMVSLVAHLMFDGEIGRGRCVYNNRSAALIAKVEGLMARMYAYGPIRNHVAYSGVLRIGYYNVALGAFLKEKSVRLRTEIRTLPSEHKRAFLRAFFDDEGCMDFRPQRNLRRVRGYQKEVSVLHLVRDLLAEFGIVSRVELPNEVIISGKNNLLLFQHSINFTPGVRVNGARSNSIWKKSLEKRELLRRAIVSFR